MKAGSGCRYLPLLLLLAVAATARGAAAQSILSPGLSAQQVDAWVFVALTKLPTAAGALASGGCRRRHPTSTLGCGNALDAGGPAGGVLEVPAAPAGRVQLLWLRLGRNDGCCRRAGARRPQRDAGEHPGGAAVRTMGAPRPRPPAARASAEAVPAGLTGGPCAEAAAANVAGVIASPSFRTHTSHPPTACRCWLRQWRPLPSSWRGASSSPPLTPPPACLGVTLSRRTSPHRCPTRPPSRWCRAWWARRGRARRPTC